MRIVVEQPGIKGRCAADGRLAQRLAGRGHQVRLISHASGRVLPSDPVEVVTLERDLRQELATAEGHRMVGAGGIDALRAARSMLERNLASWWGALWRHSQDADLLVCETTSAPALQSVAEALRRPCVTVAFQPLAPTAAFAHPLLPSARRWPGPVTRLQHRLVTQLLWHNVRPLTNRFRRDFCGLPPWPWFGPYQRLGPATPLLLAYSRHLLPPPDDWDDGISVTGFWCHQPAPAWQPPPALQAFLAAGPKPLYIGFGSMTLADPQAMAALLSAALQPLGCRVVVASGWGGLPAPPLPADRRDSVFHLDEAPHDWLLPRMAAALHHGGAGTSAAALRAGIPSVVLPFMADQFFWGRILAGQGVAPPSLPRAALSASRLTVALAQALSDQDMRRRARQLGRQIAAEDGLADAVAVIEGLLTNRS